MPCHAIHTPPAPFLCPCLFVYWLQTVLTRPTAVLLATKIYLSMQWTRFLWRGRKNIISLPAHSKIGPSYRRIRRQLLIGTAVVILLLVSLLFIKKFGQTGEEDARMQKITEYINQAMDKILTLETREEQNEAFRKLRPPLPIEPIRMTLTTAVFRYTSTSPNIILKRVIHNSVTKLNEDFMSRTLVGDNLVRTLKTFRTKHATGDGTNQILIWIFSEYLNVKLSQKAIRGDEEKIRAIIEGALKGLQQMHALSIAHLDLKIGNIMGRASKKGVVYKLIDFGYSQLMPPSGSVAIPGKNYGTYPYKPPEIVFQNLHGLKSDIWSLGAIAWFLSLQYTPFYLENMKKDISTYKKFLSTKNAQSETGYANHRFIFASKTSDSLKDFIKTCMQTDAEKRPDVSELLRHHFITGGRGRAYDGRSDEIDDTTSDYSSERVH